MGIPRFFKYILDNFRETVSEIPLKHGMLRDVTYLYIDANSILHEASREIYFPKHKRLAPIQNIKENINMLETKTFELFVKRIDELVHFVNPTCVYITTDGVPPIAKQNQQRQRRYLSVMSKTVADIKTFDSSKITPGTLFMANLTTFIHYWIRLKLSSDLFYNNKQIIFSTSFTPGEGEHKIMQFIRTLPNKNNINHCLYGVDADLFMLSMNTCATCATVNTKFYLIREDTYLTTMEQYMYVIDIQLLICQIQERWDTNIKEFIFLSFFVGNDFTHALPGCHDLESSINMMMNLHQQFLGKECIISDHGFIVLPTLLTFLKKLGEYEKDKILALIYNRNFPNETLQTSLINNTADNSIELDFFKYRELYYKKAGITDIKKCCSEYIQNLDWIHYYYNHPLKNWTWMYKYHYTPFIYDIVQFLQENPRLNRVSQNNAGPLTPFEILMCVIPPASKHVLPEFLRVIYEDDVLKKYYPAVLQIDYEGKINDWEGVTLLPFIDIKDIRQVYTKISTNPDAKKLCEQYNINTREYYLYTRATTCKKFVSKYGTIEKCFAVFSKHK